MQIKTKGVTQMNNIKKTIGIYSMKLAGLAMYRGFVLLSMEKHSDGSGRNIFFFNDSPELQELIAEYKASR